MEQNNLSNLEPYALIMKGGGIKGLAYVGALEELSKHYRFNWYAGTSAGAISAILLAAGYTHEELDEILKTKNFNDFKDANFLKKFFNLIFKGGFYKADNFRKWIGDLLAEKLESSTEVKLKDLPLRASVYATTKGKKALIYDSIDEKTNTNFASFAARCSMSIPFIFIPQKNNGYNVFDGGTQNNYPVDILLKDNPNTKFIGLYLGEEFHTIKKQKSIFGELIEIWTESNDVEAIEKYKDETIIIDPSPISTLKFSLNKNEKEFLLECGRLGALKFLAKNGKVQLNANEFKKRKNVLEVTRTALLAKVKRRKLKKKIIIWSLVGVSLFALFKNWKHIFPKPLDYFTTEIYVRGVNDEVILEEGTVSINFDSLKKIEGDIQKGGIAILKGIPIKYLNTEQKIKINHSLPYAPIDPNRKFAIREISNTEETDFKIYLEGLDKVTGFVNDYATNKPLDSVAVSYDNITVYTNKQGKFKLIIPHEKQKRFIRVDFIKEGYDREWITDFQPHSKQMLTPLLKKL